MKINVIRLHREKGSKRICQRVFVVKADTLEGLVAGLETLDESDPDRDRDPAPRGDTQ